MGQNAPRLRPVNDSGSDENPGIRVGDCIYYRHGEHGACHGEVVSVGKHGVTTDSEDGRHQVAWRDFLGFRRRCQRNLKLHDAGEDGAIMLDENGRRVYVHGYAGDGELEPMTKALPGIAQLPGADPLVDKARVCAELSAAGFEPMMDYVRETFGDHFVYRPRQEPDLAKAIDAALAGSLGRVLSEQARQIKDLAEAVSALSRRLQDPPSDG